MIRITFHWLNALAIAARSWQQDALREMQTLDAAVQQHMAHGAMAGNDPLTDSVLEQAEAACAHEGAQPPSTSATGLTPLQLAALAEAQADDWWLDLLMPASVTAVAVAAAAVRMGWWPL